MSLHPHRTIGGKLRRSALRLADRSRDPPREVVGPAAERHVAVARAGRPEEVRVTIRREVDSLLPRGSGQPPYSPNLNLIERLWKLTKTKCLCNRYYPEFFQFTAAIDAFLDSINSTYQTELDSLLSLNFQLFTYPDL